jgi:autotransporter-associated beta strand protein
MLCSKRLRKETPARPAHETCNLTGTGGEMAVRVGPFVYALGVVGASLCVAHAAAQQLAFPEAEGFGRFATGARQNLASASVYHVTNLNDAGPGSFRDAVSQSNRFVVFDVGGIVNLQSVVTFAPNITIAGQTAPGGFAVYGNRVAFHGANNIISRYWAARLGTSQGREDAASIVRGQNMIYDHMSITWGVDGTFDINPDTGQVIDNITIQNTIIGQGLDVVGHSTGGLMQVGEGNRISIIKSLFADNVTRNPKMRGENEFINNVVYGYETAGYIMGDTVNMTSNANVIGNYFIEGPVDGSSPFASGTPQFRIHAADNWVDGNRNGVLDGALNTNYPGATVVAQPHAFPTTAQMTARQAVQFVIDNVGVSITRDAVDTRLAAEVASYGTLGGVIARESDLFPNYGTDPKYLNPRARLVDADNDGINDNWERARNLNPANNADWKNLAGGYTQLENYVNELGAYGSTRTAAAGAWNTAATWGGTAPSFADTTIVSGGVTHASGHAFARRASFDGSSTLTGGTLDVFDTLLVGAGDNGTLNLSGTGVSAGRVVLGAPTRTGSLVINAGSTLQTGTIQSGGGTGSLTFGGGAFKALAAPGISVPVSVGAAGGTINTNGFDGSVSGNLSGTGTLSKTGTGTLTLSGANAGFSGPINLDVGQLALATNAANSSTGVITLANGTQLNISTSGASTPMTLADNATATLSAGGLTYNGAISGPANTTLQISSNSTGTSNFSLGGSMSGFAGKLILVGPGNIRIGSGGSSHADFDLGTSTGTVRTTFDGTVNFGSLSGGASTRLQGSTNGTAASTYVVGANGKSTTFAGTITDGTNTAPAKLNITKTGTGTLTVSNANTYTGATRISGGVLSVASLGNGGVASSIGQSSSDAANLVLDGGTLRYTGAAVTIDRAFTLTSSGGTIERNGSGNLVFGSTAPIAVPGTGDRTLTLAGTSTSFNNLHNDLGDPAAGKTSLTKSDAGTWRLLGNPKTYSGDTHITGGSLLLPVAGVLPNGAGKGNVNVSAGATLDLYGNSHTLNALNGSGTVTTTLNTTRTLTLGNGDASGIFSGTLTQGTAQTLALNKIGSGTQVLGGSNLYTGSTTVTAGTLIINGSLASSSVTVKPNATLGGNAVVQSLVTDSGSTLAPGNSIGTIAVAGNATLGGFLEIELDGTGGGSSDRIVVNGLLNLNNASLRLTNQPGGTAPDGDVHILATYTTLSGAFSNISGVPEGYRIDYRYDNGISPNHIALVPIPEPATLSLLAAGGAVMGRRWVIFHR